MVAVAAGPRSRAGEKDRASLALRLCDRLATCTAKVRLIDTCDVRDVYEKSLVLVEKALPKVCVNKVLLQWIR